MFLHSYQDLDLDLDYIYIHICNNTYSGRILYTSKKHEANTHLSKITYSLVIDFTFVFDGVSGGIN